MSAPRQSVSPTDADLARRVTAASAGEARGDEQELYRRFAPRVHAYGLRHLPDHDAANDLVQQTLELTLTKLRSGNVREPDRIASFVLGVARMQARAMRRRNRREQPVSADEVTSRLVEPAVEPRPLETERLAGCLETLGERERTILLLSFFDDRDAGEIATVVTTTPGNVRVIRHRAIDRLRRCMGLAEGEARP